MKAARVSAGDLEANRSIVDMLNKSNILTREESTAGVATASVTDDAVEGIKLEDLMTVLTRHNEDPAKHTAAELAAAYNIVDQAALANALQHVRPYRIVADERGKAHGIAVGDPEPEPDEFSPQSGKFKGVGD